MRLAEQILEKVKVSEERKRFIAKIFDKNRGSYYYSRAEKSGGSWLIGGDYVRGEQDKQYFIYSLDDAKSYVLRGRVLKFSDYIGSDELSDLEREWAKMN